MSGRAFGAVKGASQMRNPRSGRCVSIRRPGRRCACVLAAGAVAALIGLCLAAQSGSKAAPAGTYAKWERGPSRDKSFFPIAVWLQSPKNAPKYKAAGFNLYIGLWKGPTAEQIAELKKHGMPVICSQNAYAVQHLDEEIIVGWMHGDEPDNAQDITAGWEQLRTADTRVTINRIGYGKYGPPVPPARIIEDYKRMAATDPTRPVLLNLGQGVAWDLWHGRGTRKNHPEDYPEYVKGCDIASFDIYPVVHDKPEIAGNLWYVARGVERLRDWTAGRKIVWNCIECTRIHNAERKPTPEEVRAEVWMSIIHGSTGLVYFVHEWVPKFNESALLSDAEMLAAVTAMNKQIASLAPVLNSPTVPDAAAVSSENKDVPVDLMAKTYDGSTYLFAVGMRKGETAATFTVKNKKGQQTVEVLGENRTLSAKDGAFTDRFQPYAVHLYRIGADASK